MLFQLFRNCCQVFFGIDTGARSLDGHSDANSHAERQRPQLLELLADLELGWFRRDESSQDATAVCIDAVMVQSRRACL